MMEKEILVLGATGKTGKRVAGHLQKMNIPVRKGSRSGNPSFDWGKPENWSQVLNQVESVYITVQPDFAVPGLLDSLRLFVDAAKEAGVKKLVLLSGRGEEDAQEGEKIVINSGLDWTVIRASWFMQNFSEYFFLDYIRQGEVTVPKVPALEPFVDVDDIAEVAVTALTKPGHEGKLYELTGPELLSIKTAIRLISESTGNLIAYQEVTMEEFLIKLREYQLSEDLMELMEYLFSETLDGRNEYLTGDIRKVLGREPTSFREYVEKARKTGVWNTKNMEL